MKTTRKAHYPATYTRREMALLFAGFLVFLSGVPGRSETWMGSTQALATHLIRLVLVFLGLVTPTTTPIQTAKIHTPMVVVHHKHPMIKADPNSMMLRTDPILHHYTYLFEGKASYHNQPCPNASVLVRLESGDKTVTQGAITEHDGSYSLKVGIDAADNASVDWTIEAHDPEFNKVELAGRQIVRRTDVELQDPITVNNPVNFIVSLNK